jgi:hypothetical protein
MWQDKPVDSAALAATMAQLDVPYLRTSAPAEPLLLEPDALIAALAQHDSPRVRESLIPLFLRHPEYASYVPPLTLRSAALPIPASMTLRHFYTAAVYLQRLWQGKLEMYLGTLPILPDYFGQSEWGLPAPTDHYGEAGLRALAEHFQAQTGDNWLSTYQAAISLFLNQLRLQADD